jgi:cupin fold WbuC family metalloprotein
MIDWLPQNLNSFDLDKFESNPKISRICLHADESSELHVMCIKMQPNTNYPSHYHKTTDEFYILLKGELELLLDDNIILLSKNASLAYLCKAGVNHSIRNSKQDVAIFIECRKGPFNKSDTIYTV